MIGQVAVQVPSEMILERWRADCHVNDDRSQGSTMAVLRTERRTKYGDTVSAMPLYMMGLQSSFAVAFRNYLF